MIKIIKGVYGFVNKDGIVSPKTTKDEPFEIDADKEARLVEQGVAVYVEEPVKAEKPEENPVEDKAPVKKPAKKSSKKAKADEDEPPFISAADPE